MNMANKHILILGVGCTLFADQGFGVHLIQTLRERFELPDNVNLVDGGLIGVGLTGTIARADHMIAIDSFSNGGKPGDIYRLEDQQIFQRLTVKNHVQHVEFLEALAHCQALDDPPPTVLLGIEPKDTKSVECTLTPELEEKTDEMITCVLRELDRLNITYHEKKRTNICV